MATANQYHIFLIDDEPMVSAPLRAMLEVEGYRVSVFEDARKALLDLKTSPPHLILCDIVMPEMDGIDFARTVRRTYPNLPLIIMSGNPVGRNFLDAARLLGATATLPKPFDREQLVHAVETALRDDNHPESDNQFSG